MSTERARSPRRAVVRFVPVVVAAALTAFGGAVSAQTCSSDQDCADPFFCNGQEVCSPNAPNADLTTGCAPGTPPCGIGVPCDDILDECGCDDDGDGFASIPCGGTDCDDGDPNRYPGNVEVCDGGHDEDCNPVTLGGRDQDGDLFVDAACCNDAICGPDCDDLRASVNPASQEICNGLDDDCDSFVDPVISQAIGYTDLDGDGFGDANEAVDVALEVCTEDFGTLARVAGDCNNLDPRVHPGALEVCNGVDDDCDGIVDETFSEPCG